MKDRSRSFPVKKSFSAYFFGLNAVVIAAFLILTQTSCTNGIKVSESTSQSMGLPPLLKSFSVQRQRQFVVPLNSKFFIPTPVWSVQKERVNSQELSALLAQAVTARFPNVVTSGAIQDVSEAVKQARTKSANFVLYVRPNDWHQRAEDNPSVAKQVTCSPTNSWSITPNADDLAKEEDACRQAHNVTLDNARANLTLWLIDAPSGQVLDLITIESQSGLLPINQGSTDALLRAPFAEVVRRLAPSN